MITKEACEALRRELKPIAEKVIALNVNLAGAAEARANVMLAYRHLEDASHEVGQGHPGD